MNVIVLNGTVHDTYSVWNSTGLGLGFVQVKTMGMCKFILNQNWKVLENIGPGVAPYSGFAWPFILQLQIASLVQDYYY